LEKDEKFGAKCDRTKLKKNKNLEEKRREMRPLAECSKQNDGGTYEMYVNYLYPPKFDGDNIGEG